MRSLRHEQSAGVDILERNCTRNRNHNTKPTLSGANNASGWLASRPLRSANTTYALPTWQASRSNIFPHTSQLVPLCLISTQVKTRASRVTLRDAAQPQPCEWDIFRICILRNVRHQLIVQAVSQVELHSNITEITWDKSVFAEMRYGCVWY